MTDKILAVAGESLSQKCRERLAQLGFEVVILPSYERLGRGVDTHADMMLFALDNRIFTYKGLGERLRELGREYEIAEIAYEPSEKYPDDIALNCLKVGKYIFCKRKHTAKEVLEYAEKGGYTVVNINQGYARCSACPVGDMGLISADPSMLAGASVVGIDRLPINAGSVSLDGFDYGFIGGACGYCDGSLYFSGDLRAHPDGDRIESFCKGLGVDAVSLSDEPLKDVGSIFFFKIKP